MMNFRRTNTVGEGDDDMLDTLLDVLTDWHSYE
jgi:hypothetical protein